MHKMEDKMGLLKKGKEKKCDHKFEDFNAIVIKDFPRMVCVCKRCGVCIHRKIYTIDKLAELENGQ